MTPRSPRATGESTSARFASFAYRLAQRAMTLDVTRLMWLEARDVRIPGMEDRFEFSFLSSDDVRAYALDAGNDLTASFADRMLAGHDLCYAARHAGALAAYVWLALGSIEPEQNRGRQRHSGVALSFGPETAFVYKAYTRPEYRGQRLYPMCLCRALRELTARDISRLLVTTDVTNRAALNGCRQADFHDLGRIWRFGWKPLLFTVAPYRCASLGIRVGRKARVASRARNTAWCGIDEPTRSR